MNITNMSYMFNECSTLKKLNINKFNTSNVINISGMFRGVKNLTKANITYENVECNTQLAEEINNNLLIS